MRAHRLAGEHGSRGRIVERDVVRGVPGGVDDVEVAASDRDPVAVAHGADPRRVDRQGLAVEGPHPRLPVGPGGARHEAGGVDQVGCASFVHPHGGPCVPAEQHPHAARVIEVDVGDDDVGEVAGAEADPLEAGLEGGGVGGGGGFHEDRLVAADHVHGVERVEAGRAGIDRRDRGGHLEGRGFRGAHAGSLAHGVGGRC